MWRDRSGSEPARRVKAGTSAQSIYDEQRKAWIRRNRRVFWVLDGIVALTFVASVVVWQAWTPAAWYCGLIAGMVVCFDLAVRLNPPTWIEQWQSGAIGEQRTGRELSRLGPEWLVVHDLRRSNGANIDHVVVGPSGVYLLDSKNIGAEMRVEGDELTVFWPDGRSRYKDRTGARKARGAAAALSEALTAAQAGCWVHAVLVVWGDMPQRHVPATNLDWVAGSNIVDWLSSLPVDRNPDRLTRVKSALTTGTLNL